MIGNETLAYDLEVAPKRTYAPNKNDFKVIKSKNKAEFYEKSIFYIIIIFSNFFYF